MASSVMAVAEELTLRQSEVYRFIREQILDRGYGPTVREIGLRLGIRSPNGVMCHLKALERKGYIVREPHSSRAIRVTEGTGRSAEISLEGEVCAGYPVEAVSEPEQISFDFLFARDRFALRVRGDSMVEEHIADGDLVIVRRQSWCNDGEVVVALIDGTDATLKRFYCEKDRCRLQPTNSRMRSVYANDVAVLGVVVAVLRMP